MEQEQERDAEVWEEIAWTVGDVKALLEDKGYRPTDENAWRVIHECGHSFRDRCTELAWEVLDTYVDITDDLEPDPNAPEEDEDDEDEDD